MEIHKVGTILIHGDKRCLNRCSFCPGTVDESISVEDKFKKFLKDAEFFLSKGYKEIEVSGNDPIQYSRIVEAIKHLKDNGIEKIVLSTHGRNMRDNKLTEDLAKAGLDTVRIPLYGPTAEIHNQAMQYVSKKDPKPLSVGDSFADTIVALKNCAENDIMTRGHICPMQFNQDVLSETIDLYLELTQGKMENLVVASACVSFVDHSYTADWYLPIKDSKRAVRSILNHRIKKDFPHIYFKVLDYPFCVPEIIHTDMKNVAVVPNLGNSKVAKEIRSKESDYIPSYRIKKQISECSKCLANKICAGIYENDVKLFGAEGLKAITLDDLLDKNYQQDIL